MPQAKIRSHRRFWAALALLAVCSVCLALFWGFWQQWSWPKPAILTQLRLPRTLLAFCTGSLLSLAGVQMQAALRNPLADPYILGTASGAGVFALAAVLMSWPVWAIQAAGMTGAIVATILVLWINLRRPDPLRTLLVGVGLAAGFSALITLMLSLSPSQQLNSLLFWLMGDLSSASSPVWLVPLTLATLFLAWRQARVLDVLSLGLTKASTLGLDARRSLLVTLAFAALLTGIAVSLAGPIGFVGLLIPHILRLWHGSLHQELVPASALLGGSFLLLADTLAQHLFAPYQLPVGAVTALAGAPWLIWLLWQRREVAHGC